MSLLNVFGFSEVWIGMGRVGWLCPKDCGYIHVLGVLDEMDWIYPSDFGYCHFMGVLDRMD